MREHWREPGFWRWWWQSRVSTDAKIATTFLVVMGLAFGGYAASRLTAADAAAPAADSAPRTVTEVVTIRSKGGGERRAAPVARTETVRGAGVTHTAYDTRTVAGPGETRTVTAAVTRTVPKVERRVVTVAAQPVTRTVVRTRPGGVVTRTVTNDAAPVPPTPPDPVTVTVPGSDKTRTVTTVRTVTQEPVTSVKTVTEEPKTKTTTVERTTTVVQTTTATVALTTTLPPLTVTVTTTVPLPKK